MSQFSININLNDKEKNYKRKQMNYEQLQNQYDALFRNLQSFSKTILHQSKSKTSFNEPMIPKSRYFNLRVEFKKCNKKIHNSNSSTSSNGGTTDINRNDMLLDIPWALDPSLEVNKCFLVQNYNENSDNASSTSNQCTNRVPSITKSLKDLIHLPIGKVVEKNVTGLGVQLIAYHRDDNDDDVVDADDGDSANDINEIYSRMCSNKDVNNKLNGNQNNDELIEARLNQGRELTQKLNGVASESEYIPFRNNTIAKGTTAFALPHNQRKVTRGTRKTDDAILTLKKCAILDHRIRKKKSILDYKVQFFDQGLEKANMKKQWIAFNKVIPYHEMKEKASYELERSMVGVDLTICHSIPSTVMQNVAMKLNLDVENIEKLIFNSPKNEISENESTSDDLNDITQKKCAENFNLVYSYAANPVTVVF